MKTIRNQRQEEKEVFKSDFFSSGETGCIMAGSAPRSYATRYQGMGSANGLNEGRGPRTATGTGEWGWGYNDWMLILQLVITMAVIEAGEWAAW